MNTPKDLLNSKTGQVYNPGLNYLNWIDTQGLYIHNHKEYYENTSKKINEYEKGMLNFAKLQGLKYIKILEQREKQILSGTQEPEKVLQMIANEGFVNNDNIQNIIKLLDEVFLRNNIKFSVVSKTDKQSGSKQNYFKIINGNKSTEIKIDKIGVNTEGNNIYNYDEAAKGYEAILQKLVNSMNIAIDKNNGISAELQKVLNKTELSDTINASNFLNFLNTAKVLGQGNTIKNENAKTPSGQLLQFFIDNIGLYISLRGKFIESAKTGYKAELNKLINGQLRTRRRDYSGLYDSTPKLNKVDNVIYGGAIQKTNPLTISRKVSTTRGAIKIHDTSIQAIIDALMQENSQIGNIYLYIMLNNPFWGESNNSNIDFIKQINRYMSYLFMSGSSSDSPENQAMYLVMTGKQTKKQGGGMITTFVPFSILIRIILGIEDETKYYSNFIKSFKNGMTVNLDMSGIGMSSNPENLFVDLWKYKKLAASKNGGKLRYQFLNSDPEVIGQIKNIKNSVLNLTKSRKINMSYPQLEKAAKLYMENTGIIV